LGALYLSAASFPSVSLLRLLGLPKIFAQLAVRLTLAALTCTSLVGVIRASGRRLGSPKGAVAALLAVCVTPHFLFYASRTLPNVFALYLVERGTAHWMRMEVQPATVSALVSPWSFPKHLTRAIAYFVCAVLWVRCDMLVLLGPVALSWLVTRKATFPQLVVIGGAVGTLALLTTVLVDSVFWGRWLWPEGVVLFFNTVENKSHQWGVMPPHWYITSALPRAFLLLLPFLVVGLFRLAKPQTAGAGAAAAGAPPPTLLSLLSLPLRTRVDWRVAEFVLPVFLFIALYSFLPHKELRFLLPSFPVLYVGIGSGFTKVFGFAVDLLLGQEEVEEGGEGGANRTPASPAQPGPAAPVSPATAAGDETGEGSAVAGGSSSSSSSSSSSNGGLRQRKAPSRRPSGLRVDTAAAAAAAAAAPPAPAPTSPASPSPSSRPRLAPGAVPVRLVGAGLLSALAASLLGSAFLTAVFVRVSVDNYPGGVALQALYTRYAVDLQRAARVDRSSVEILRWTFEEEAEGKPLSSRALPPCPEGDVTATGAAEWWRQCMGEGCPHLPPWSTAFRPAANRPCAGYVGEEEEVGERRSGVAVGGVSSSSSSSSPRRPRPLLVHIDGAAAESGVSRFGEAWGSRPRSPSSSTWVYSKAEGLVDPASYASFDLLLTANVSFHKDRFTVVETVPGLPRVQWSLKRLPQVITEPAVFIMKRKPDGLEFRPAG
jgi:hypothetical protein